MRYYAHSLKRAKAINKHTVLMIPIENQNEMVILTSSTGLQFLA